MSRIQFIRKENGRIVEKGEVPAADFELMKKRKPGYEIDTKNTPLTPLDPVVVPEVEPTGYPSLEQLTDAVLKLADGDRKPIDNIKADIATGKKNAAAKHSVRKRRAR
jgi:hypothetical protein